MTYEETVRQIGDRAWMVETCVSIPLDENGDADLDRAKYLKTVHGTRDDAIAYARSVLPRDAFGAVSVNEVEWTDDPDGFGSLGRPSWHDVGEAEYVDAK